MDRHDRKLALHRPLAVGDEVRATFPPCYARAVGFVEELVTPATDDAYLTGRCRLFVRLHDGRGVDFLRCELTRAVSRTDRMLARRDRKAAAAQAAAGATP